MLCTPLLTFEAKGPPDDQQRIVDVAVEHDAAAIIVGMPINMDGSHGPAARRVTSFCRTLRTLTGTPVIPYDERLTSSEAEARLRAAGVQPSRDKGRIDSAAAALILESYLASQRGG
jgi:putative Holliday junction resolvase